MVLDETSDLDAILCGLEEFEYGWAYRVLDSQYFGLAQRRKRVFIIACAGGRMDRAAEILFESNCLPWHPAPSRQSWERVAGTISARTKGGGGLGTDFDLDGGLIGTRQGVRRLMPVECERLQGLPDGHTAWGINEKGERVEMSDSARYRMIGNGVSVPVIEWIAKRTRKMMESML
jgi:site-specific DNA-cytosine methylase